MYTPEQVEYAMALPLSSSGRITVKDLAEQMGRDTAEVEKNVECMAREGRVLVTTSRKDGKKYYALWTLLPGAMESTFADGIDNDERRKLARLFGKYAAEGFWNEMASSDYSQFRVIPVNQTVESSSSILPYEEVHNIINNADVITVIPCTCRVVSRKCNHLVDADFVFGAWADYLIKYRGARKWTKEEALQRLKECEEDGLMHLTANVQDGAAVICNCCTCCCKAMKGLVELHNPRSFVKSNFEPEMDDEKCILCKKCEKICQLGAITKLPGFEADGSDTRMIIQNSRCVGCGLCSTHCPEDAITMKKVRDEVPAENLMEMNKLYREKKVW
jgi:electron transport complex protein RnfB